MAKKKSKPKSIKKITPVNSDEDELMAEDGEDTLSDERPAEEESLEDAFRDQEEDDEEEKGDSNW